MKISEENRVIADPRVLIMRALVVNSRVLLRDRFVYAKDCFPLTSHARVDRVTTRRFPVATTSSTSARIIGTMQN